jgi:dethiobiotin synthetase
MKPLIVTGTDTSVGKTVVAAMLTLALNGIYWKPIQSGLADKSDRERVADLTGLPASHFRPEAYRLRQPLSPHRAAELDGVEIDPDALGLPSDIPDESWLIVEGVGGLLVPINRGMLLVELFSRWRAPAVLVARTALGTINHTLLSLKALKCHDVDVLGVIFVGESSPDSERTIVEFGRVKRLGHLPLLPVLDAKTLNHAFETHFHRGDFEDEYRS